jgi:hypothetical protein
MIDLLKERKKEIKTLISNNRKNKYSYLYLKDLISNDELNEKYGKSRGGFEQFREDENIYIDPPDTSLRSIINKDTKACKGFVLEKTEIENNEDEIRELYIEALNNLIKYFNGGELLKSFLIEYEINDLSSFKTDYNSQIDSLIEIYEKYQFDSDFKQIVDSIARVK